MKPIATARTAMAAMTLRLNIVLCPATAADGTTAVCLCSVFRSRANPNRGKNENFLVGRFDEPELRIGFSRFVVMSS
jgi:hypothetical protein